MPPAVNFGATAGNVTARPATSITVTSPAGAGTVDVTVTTLAAPRPLRATTSSAIHRSAWHVRTGQWISDTPSGVRHRHPPRFASPISGSGAGAGALTVAQYASNPTAGAVSGGPVSTTTSSWLRGATCTSVTITVCSLGAGGQSISWWNGSAWLPFSDQTFDSSTGCVTATVTAARRRRWPS